MSLNLYTGRKRNFYFGGLTQPRKRNWIKILTHNSGQGIYVSASGEKPKAEGVVDSVAAAVSKIGDKAEAPKAEAPKAEPSKLEPPDIIN